MTVHGQVLVAIADNPRALMRELAEVTGITERTVQAVIADLDAAGYLTRERRGRRNHYTIHPDAPLRHSGSGIREVGPVLDLLARRNADRGEPEALNPEALNPDGTANTSLKSPPIASP